MDRHSCKFIYINSVNCNRKHFIIKSCTVTFRTSYVIDVTFNVVLYIIVCVGIITSFKVCYNAFKRCTVFTVAITAFVIHRNVCIACSVKNNVLYIFRQIFIRCIYVKSVVICKGSKIHISHRIFFVCICPACR